MMLASTRAFWFATRGTGVVSLLLLTAIVVLGVAGTTRLASPRWPRFVVAGLHRNLTLLALAFIALHVLTTVVDGFAPIGLKDAVIPFASPYRPIWLGLGAVAFDLLLALTVTSLLRARIGMRLWRALHWLAYLSWPVALAHSLGTGTDARLGWMQLLALGSTLAVVCAVGYRLTTTRAAGTIRAGAAAVTLVVPLVLGIWYAGGPGARGWAARAGTPAALLPAKRTTRVAAPARTATTANVSLPSLPFTRSFRGTITETQPDANGRVVIDIRGRTSAPHAGSLWVRLQGEPVVGGGVSMTASGASFGPSTNPRAYVGTIAGLEGTRLLLDLHGQSRRLAVLVDVRIQAGSRAVSGEVRVQPGTGESE